MVDNDAEQRIRSLELSDRLPFTLAAPFRRAATSMQEELYRDAVNHILDFYEIGTQYASAVIFKLLLDKGFAESLEPVVRKIDLKRPLSFGDWMVDIFTYLLTTARKLMPEHPLVAALAEQLMVKRVNILLGYKKDRSIVQVRNDTRGHDTTLSERIYKRTCGELLPRMYKFLEGLAPLAAYEAFGAAAPSEVYSFRGAGNPQPVEQPGFELDDHHYYLVKEDETLDLFPLLAVNKSAFVYVFQTLDQDHISFVSSNLDAEKVRTEEFNRDFDAMMQRVQPGFDIERAINWQEAKTAMWEASGEFLKRVYKEKKYNQELFVQRKTLDEHLHEFLAGSATLFPLLGEAGQGKTNQLCYWTESFIESGNAVLIFNCNGFANTTLEECLRDVWGFSPRKSAAKMMGEIHNLAVKADCNIVFFFDAINECFHYGNEEYDTDASLRLYLDILRILVSESYPRFKTVFTCRTFVWHNLLMRHTPSGSGLVFNASDNERYHIRGFSAGEVASAYDIYRPMFQMRTSFEKVDSRVKVRLKDPLVLKFACTNSLGKEMSGDVARYTTVALFDRMMEDIAGSYAGGMQARIIMEISRYMWKCYVDGKPVDSVSVRELREAFDKPGSPLHTLSHLVYKKGGAITIAYAELLNKPERPVLREGSSAMSTDTKIQFVYERFLEYVLARAIDGWSAGRILQPASFYVNILNTVPLSSVLMAALRNAILMDYTTSGDASTIIDLILDRSDNYNIRQLVNEVITTLIRENYEDHLFALEKRLLKAPDAKEAKEIEEFNLLTRKIERNEADGEIIRRYKELSDSLFDLMALRRTASVSIINGILLTDYFNLGLYNTDVLALLWSLIEDEITEVRNDACTYIYYLSNKTHTSEGTALSGNLSLHMAREMIRIVKSRPLLVNALGSHSRKRTVTFIETAVRLLVILIIDAAMVRGDRGQVSQMLDEIDSLVRYCSWNFNLIRLVLPFFQIVLRRQITFQSDYVNNAMEYENFWDDSVVPPDAGPAGWSRRAFAKALRFMHHHSRYAAAPDSEACRKDTEEFRALRPAIVDAYRLGDAFSNFALERLLVIMGTTDWENIAPIVRELFSDEEIRSGEWFDYNCMSLLYVLYQVAVNSKKANPEILEIYERECREWTLKTRGIFKTRTSHKANDKGVYKRNLINWYCMVYFSLTPEGKPLSGHDRCVPMAYELIDRAFSTDDKELLYHIIDSITELVTDNGLFATAMDLIYYILSHVDSPKVVEAIDAVALDRPGIYQKPFVELINNFFTTAKNYDSEGVNTFIRGRLTELSYPGTSSLKDDLLQFNPGGEKLSDLLTHKFGNFLMWSLLNEEAVDDFSYEAMAAAVNAGKGVAWYNDVVKILLRHMFNVKL